MMNLRREKGYLLRGRIMAFRDFGKSCFFHIQDRKGKIQVYVRKDILKDLTMRSLRNLI